jgi:hypothetical protein
MLLGIRRRPPLVVALVAGMTLGGCGYVGEPLPPALNIPERVQDLRVVQRGDVIVVHFTVPGVTTETLPLPETGEVDLRGGPMPGGDFKVESWADSAQKYPAEGLKPGPATLEIPAGAWTGQEIAIAVRIQHPRGRYSSWSNIVPLRVIPPVPVPAGLRAESVAGGVRLTWAEAEPGLEYRIYRRESAVKETSIIGSSAKPEFLDPAVDFGKTYEYSVEALRKSGGQETQSLRSATVSLTREDRFAPAVPRGVTAVAGNGSIELAWPPSADSDLAGYRVYRSANGAEFTLIAESGPVASYSDRSVQAGKTYRYAVSAVDQLQNESSRSEVLEITAQ